MAFILLSPAKEQFDFKGKSLGMDRARAVYISPALGEKRFYRSSYPNPSHNLRVLTFNDYDKALEAVKRVNEVYNDDFSIAVA